ncbi:MFS transporter [Pseudescherichia vulneris]|uniref:MFS transporter n=1 Tax=Pseudescherichia vulneris TaxID=566 RepID=UPI0028D57800|nr:MFS transporter [Pseudescherichia vulneris]
MSPVEKPAVIHSRSSARILLAHLVLASGGFAIGTGEFATMSFLPAFTHEFGGDAPAGGHVVSAYALGVVLGAPLLAVLGARVERRLLLMLLLGWFALGNLLSALAPTLHSLITLRFFTAIIHGAYFGAAVLVAVNIAGEQRQSRAVARILMGLALATTLGVPLTRLIIHWSGWRMGYAVIGLFSMLVVVLLRCMLPLQAAEMNGSLRQELGALRRPQVWLSVGIGAIGFGDLFAIYSYLASTLQAINQASDRATILIFCTFGAGIAFGNMAASKLASRGTMPAVGLILLWSAAATLFYSFSIPDTTLIGLSVFAVGCGGGLGTLLQMRLMAVAGEAQNLAASLNHVAFNIANALGPWLAGIAIASGLGWASTGWTGFILALGGLIMWSVAVFLPDTSE